MTTEDVSDLLYGASEIAKFLNMKVPAARHLIEVKKIPTFRIGSRVCARKPTLTRWLAELEAAAASVPAAEPAAE